MKMMEIGTYFGKRWFVADEGFEQPGLYYWNELQQAHIRAWKPGRPLDIPGEVDALRKERVVLQDENEGLRVDLRKLSDIEVIAERLAKVEDRLAGTPTLDGVNREMKESFRRIDERIDKVVEIIGERVSDLVDQIERLEQGDLFALRQRQDEFETRTVGRLNHHSADLARLLHLIFDEKPEPAFPTDFAPSSTAEAAAEAVLPVPQRGDRVRLEDALTNNGQRVSGWFDVIGADAKWGCFQIEVAPDDIRKGRWLPWVANDNSGLKEVKRNGTPR